MKPFKYFVFWPDNSSEMTNNIGEALRSADTRQRSDNGSSLASGAVVVLDLEALGKLIATRANGPLVRISDRG